MFVLKGYKNKLLGRARGENDSITTILLSCARVVLARGATGLRRHR